MPSKPIELPLEVARAFVRDMRAFFAEKSPIKRDEIASRQIHVLRSYQGKHERPIKLHQGTRSSRCSRRCAIRADRLWQRAKQSIIKTLKRHQHESGPSCWGHSRTN
jgi:hypothetical protein